MTRTAPPRFAAWLLRAVTPSEDRAFVFSDLHEEFETYASSHGVTWARRWYVRQVLTSIVPLVAARFDPPRVTQFAQHVRHSLGAVRAAPGASAAAITTLALGIGANTAVFSVVDAVLLRPLPYTQPERLVSVWQVRSGQRTVVAPGDYAEYAAAPHVFEALGAYMPATRALSAGDAAEELPGDVVTVNLFPMLGVQPALGRTFTPEDARPGAAATVIVSSALWHSRFASDASIIGRSVSLNGEPQIVIGVMPADFVPPSGFASADAPTFFLPAPEVSTVASRADRTLHLIGRLAPGVTLAQAAEVLNRIDATLATHYAANRDTRAALASLDRDITRGVRVSLIVILACVGLVVLIASVNVANLLIVQAMGHRHEFAIRLALGAARSDIIFEYAVRGLVLATAGATSGIAVGIWTRDLLIAAAPASIPRLNDLTLNPRVLGATALITVATGLMAGAIPALQLLSDSRRGDLNVTAKSSASSPRARRWQGALVAAEVAAAVIIALGAGLLVRSVIQLNRIDVGFETERVLTMRLRPPQGNVDPAARLLFFQHVSERIARIPGVQSVAFANDFPLRGGWKGKLQVLGRGEPVDAAAEFQAVSDSYFATLSVPLLRGRFFDATDQGDSPPVIVVSQTFADQLLRGQEPIGAIVRRNPAAPALRIVGVVGEIRRNGKFAEAAPQVFFPATQTRTYAVGLEALAVRVVRGDPRTWLPAIRQVIAEEDAQQTLSRVRALDELLKASVASWRFNMLLLTSFAGLALMLAIVGVHGVVAHAAAQRTREIGIRTALGASRSSIIASIVGSALRWAAAGVCVGLVGAYLLARGMAAMLFNTAPTDALTYGMVTGLMLIASLCASYLPARRAAAADPVHALRNP